jgi:hypothetical protein
MCGGGGGGGNNAESIALQRESLALSRKQFEESKKQWGASFDWQKKRAEEQKKIAQARAGKGPVNTADYAASALGDRNDLGFGKHKYKKDVQGSGLSIT